MFKIVIDTNILIDAWQDDFSYTRRILDEVIKGNLKAFASHKIWREYQLILNRLVNNPRHYELANRFFSAVEMVEPRQKLNVVKYDPEDNKFFEAALAAQADYIITQDSHFFEVGEYQGIQPIKPKDFWLKYQAVSDEGGQNEWQNWMKNIMGQ